MDKYVKFEVPAEVLGDFMQEANSNGFTATTSGTTRKGEHIITIPYDKEQEDDIEALQEYLDDLIEDAKEER